MVHVLLTTTEFLSLGLVCSLFTNLWSADECYNAKYIDFKDKSVSTSDNGQPHYKGQNARSQIVHYREVHIASSFSSIES